MWARVGAAATKRSPAVDWALRAAAGTRILLVMTDSLATLPAPLAPTVPAAAATAIPMPGTIPGAPALPSDLATLLTADPMTLTLRAFGGTRRLVGAMIADTLAQAAQAAQETK